MTSKQKLKIKSNTLGLELIPANRSHLNYLREWKNSQREFFFYNKEISNLEQVNWFDSYIIRNDDYMFMVIYNGVTIGCMGIRIVDSNWDIYNVILGQEEYGGKGYMGSGFQAMLKWATELNELPITLKVLKHNPAVSWYKKQGLVIIDSNDLYYSMKYI